MEICTQCCMPVPFSQTHQMKQQVASAFLDKFQLKLEEIKILRGPRDGALHEVGRLGTGMEVFFLGGGGRVIECVGKFQLKLEEIKILHGPQDGALHEVGRLG